MDYFIMRQENGTVGLVQPVKGFSSLLNPATEQKNEDLKTTVVIFKDSDSSEFPDYIEQYKLVSEKLKRIMSKYENDAVFKTVVLIEESTNRQKIYYHLALPQIQCTSVQSVYTKLGNMKEFVLDEEKVGSTRIFCAENYKDRVFVRLDVAESILRRDSYGVLFERVATGNRELEDHGSQLKE